ncbi:MAG: CHC2 zinc finger domain-containing protein [Inquilinus sp.]|uniref:CHC2 zinc finger domain-containing protein n=1 Tax=Inquilinus sp. TaxID=1932117 RepID=UPI003F3EF45E
MSTRIEAAEIQALLDRVSLADLAGKRGVLLKKRGNRLWGLCPFHAEKSPSFTILTGRVRDRFHCFGCGASGDAIGFLQQLDRKTFAEAVEALGGPQQLTEADRQRIERQRRRIAEAERRSRAAKREGSRGVWFQAQRAAGTPAEAYLRARAVDLDALAEDWPRGMPPSLRFAEMDYMWRPEDAPDDAPWISLGKFPAMVGGFQSPAGQVVAVHLTYLAERDGVWGKAQVPDPETGEILPTKKIRGMLQGGAIRFGAAGPLLYAGEGIETSLSVLCRLRRAGRPGTVWAAGSLDAFAGGAAGLGPRRPLPPVELPDGHRRWLRRPSPRPDPARPGMAVPDQVRRFVWLGDSDGKDPVDGQLIAARGLTRLRWQGIDARAVWAPAGMDFNDVVQALAADPGRRVDA